MTWVWPYLGVLNASKPYEQVLVAPTHGLNVMLWYVTYDHNGMGSDESPV